MKASAVIAALLRRAWPQAAAANSALKSHKAAETLVQDHLAAWAAAWHADERFAELVSAADCVQRQVAGTAAAFGDTVAVDALQGLAEESRQRAILLRLVALTETRDLIKPDVEGGLPVLDPEALETAVLEADWLDFSDEQLELVEAVEPHLFALAALFWDPQAGPRSRRYVNELHKLASTVAELRPLSLAGRTAGALAQQADAWVERN